jgi:hypothetical protein
MSPLAAIKSATSVAAQLLDQGDNFEDYLPGAVGESVHGHGPIDSRFIRV